MPEVNGLSVSFVEGHPTEAARVLEGLAAADGAEFLAALAPKLAVAVLRHLRPAFCTKLFEHLDDEQIGRLLHLMGPQEVSQLLQHVSMSRQTQLITRLPVATAIAVRLLIGYPKGTCGAVMDPSPFMVSPEASAREALEQLRQFAGDPGDCIFVCDAQRRLLGVIEIAELVRASAADTMADVMSAPQHTVSALGSVSSTARHEGWERFHILPVVERENRLVGAAHRRIVLRHLSGGIESTEPPLASGAAGAYWQTLSLLAEGLVRALPPVAPIGKVRKNDER